jgi:hypothetical protein
MMAWRFERRNTGGAACISGIFVFGNRSSVSDSVDPSFQDYLQDKGQTKVFLHFGSLKNSMGTSRPSPGPREEVVTPPPPGVW